MQHLERICEGGHYGDTFVWPFPIFSEPSEADACHIIDLELQPDDLANPNIWNLSLAVVRDPEVVTNNRPRSLPEPEQYPLNYIRAVIRNQCKTITDDIGSPEDRLRQACRSVSKFVGAGLTFEQATRELANAAIEAGMSPATIKACLREELRTD